MSREIKFRAWDKESNKYIYFDFKNIYGYEGEASGVVLPDKYTMLNYNSGYGNNGFNENIIIEQSTNRFDKNRKEIFDGDKVRLSSDYSICGNIPREGFVVWLNEKSMYVVVSEKNLNDIWHHHTPLHEFPVDKYEVIGNVHESGDGE